MLNQDAVIRYQTALSSLSTLATFCTAITATGVSYLGYQQWRLAKNKFRLDLFEKRYHVFEAARKFLVIILQEGSFEQADLFQYFAGIGDSQFLFKDETTKYLQEIADHAVKMRALARQYENLPVGDARTRLIEAEGTELRWLTDQLRSLNKMFPELKFES